LINRWSCFIQKLEGALVSAAEAALELRDQPKKRMPGINSNE
jgi:hypothetical protein